MSMTGNTIARVILLGVVAAKLTEVVAGRAATGSREQAVYDTVAYRLMPKSDGFLF
jgi:hypothetical protein